MKTRIMARFACLLSVLAGWLVLAGAVFGQVTITSPTNGQTFAEGEPVQIVSEAHSSDGYVLTTTFSLTPDDSSLVIGLGPVTNHLDGIGVSGDDPLDYSSDASLILTNLIAGGYTLGAYGVDVAGNSLTSAPVHITISAPTNAFTVAIISPTNGAIFAGPTNIEISANIGWTPGLGFPHEVTFYDGTNLITRFELDPGPTNFTLSYPLKAAALGLHTLTVVAQGSATDAVTSAPVNITVVPVITSPYIATILSPTNGLYPAPTNILITGLFGWLPGGPSPHFITFYDGTNVLLHLVMDPAPTNYLPTTFTLTYKWAATVGQHVLTVVASGVGGPAVISAPVYIVIPTPPPSVSIIATRPVAVRQSPFILARPAHPNDEKLLAPIPAIFTLCRSSGTNSDLVVYYGIGGTAPNGVDYVLIPGELTIPAGEWSATIKIIPLQPYLIPAVAVGPFSDRVATVILSLEPPPHGSGPYQIETPSKAEAIIVNFADFPCPPTGCLPDGTFHLDMPATNGLVYCLETSTNLVDWTPILTNTVTEGSIDFVDPDAGLFGQRFYRAEPVAWP